LRSLDCLPSERVSGPATGSATQVGVPPFSSNFLDARSTKPARNRLEIVALMLPTPSKKNVASDSADFGRYAGLGLQFVVTLALFGGLGWWLDGKWSTTPWLLVTGVFLGAIIAFIAIVKAVPPAKAVHPTRPYLEDEPADKTGDDEADKSGGDKKHGDKKDTATK